MNLRMFRFHYDVCTFFCFSVNNFSTIFPFSNVALFLKAFSNLVGALKR